MARLAQRCVSAGYTVYNWDYPSRQFGVMPLVDALEDLRARRLAHRARASTSSRTAWAVCSRAACWRAERVPTPDGS